MSKRLTEKEILEFLEKVETGEITLTPDFGCIPQDVFAGDVPYEASNGWKITVFNDCNEWDYLDSLQKGGQLLEYSALVRHYPQVAYYRPSDEIAWTRYGIPGYLKSRCLVCGKELTENDFGREDHGWKCFLHRQTAPHGKPAPRGEGV